MSQSSQSWRSKWQLEDEAAMVRLAHDFGQVLQAPIVIYLQGDLGAGKTTFARALIQGLGYSGRVKSPTYGLLESYQVGGFDFLHLDLYRIQDPAELEYLAIADQFTQRGVLLVEWPEKAFTVLPSADIRIKINEIDSGRSMEIVAESEIGRAVIAALSTS
ncbi:MAG TPA: tRNA (adenosine(37)-N6)-threonylcarbamoyltransferase complex ATPase subunit type 1 TsaE [Xanthomonadales bacterium]|nr:tRNA (adenosine(37)-N6)-threonylcarbamoyltransferase complex ATPase subunit type 1 TsaE [Xanthomonadales bacterium]